MFDLPEKQWAISGDTKMSIPDPLGILYKSAIAYNVTCESNKH